MSGKLYLGLDCGTQSIRGTIIDERLQTLLELSVVFDKDLPHYQTSGGCHRKGDRVTAPPQMWVEALDKLFHNISTHPKCPNLALVQGVSFSGQQHGSVYWRAGARKLLQALNPQLPLLGQLADGGAFAAHESPIWMDSSTARECAALERAVGGAEKLAAITGSRAYERFTGNQIAKMIKDYPVVYANTERISVVSSFLASILIGDYSPIDAGDGSGMNLLDIHSKQWHPAALACVAQGGNVNALLQKVGPAVAESFDVVGNVSPYFVRRYGMAPSCRVVAASGDNNNSLLGMKSQGNDMVVSLGTSDTVTSSVRVATPGLEGHVLCHPVLKSGFMVMLCFSNGSLTREWVRDQYAGGSWDRFSQALQATPIGNDGNVGFYFLTQEIVPQHRRKGCYRFAKNDALVSEFPKPKAANANYDVRAVLEGQFLSRRLHSAKLGMKCEQVSRVVVCGGAAANNNIVQVLADVFGVPVFRDAGTNAAAFGAALRAMHGVLVQDARASGSCSSSNMMLSEEVYNQIASKFTPLEKICDPRMSNFKVYTEMLPRFAALEGRIPFESKL